MKKCKLNLPQPNNKYCEHFSQFFLLFALTAHCEREIKTDRAISREKESHKDPLREREKEIQKGATAIKKGDKKSHCESARKPKRAMRGQI